MRGAIRRRLAGVSHGALVVIVLLVAAIVFGIPTALLFGAGDAIFGSPREGLKTFFATLGLCVVWFLVSFAWDMHKQSKRERERGRRRPRGR